MFIHSHCDKHNKYLNYCHECLAFLLNKILKRYFPPDFPGSPVVKILLSKAGAAGLITGWGAKIPYASWPKNQNMKQKQ